MITYRQSVRGLTPAHLQGFFVGWVNPPSPETHWRILQGSDAIELAVDDESGQVVGFITALTDHVLIAYIPLLEVLPAYQARGIGSELVRRLLQRFEHLYGVDLLCDDDVKPFYARHGMTPWGGMMLRRIERQSGA